MNRLHCLDVSLSPSRIDVSMAHMWALSSCLMAAGFPGRCVSDIQQPLPVTASSSWIVKLVSGNSIVVTHSSLRSSANTTTNAAPGLFCFFRPHHHILHHAIIGM